MKLVSGETDMNRFSSHLTMKILLYTKDSRLRAYQRHDRQGVFKKFFVTDPPHRKPLRGLRHSSDPMDRGVTISASYLNTTIFIGNPDLMERTDLSDQKI